MILIQIITIIKIKSKEKMMNAEMKTECKLEVKEKQTLKSLLTEVQIEELQSGNMVATCGGQKLRLNDEIKGTVMILSPLQGG